MIGLVVAALLQCPDGSPPPCGGTRAAPPTIVIAPFENRSRDTADTYLAAALGEDITAALQRSRVVRVMSAHAGRRGIDYQVSGSVARDAGALRLVARLERTGPGEIVWTGTVSRPLARSGEAADLVADSVLGRIAGHASQRHAGPAPTPVDPAAWDLYLRGRYYSIRRTEADIGRAVALFQQAVGKDSGFALGWAGLANALSYAARWHLPVRGMTQRQAQTTELEAAERALLTDSGSAEIWITRARAAEDVDPTTRTSSRRAALRAIALDSLDANAWAYLSLMNAEAGDSLAARSAGRRAVALDPGNPETMVGLSVQYYWARRYDSSSVWTDSMLAVDPTFLSGRRMAGTIALARGRIDEAETQFGAARRLGPGPERIWTNAGLACAMVARGDTAAARAMVADALTLTDSIEPALHSAVFVAWGYAAIGDHARAIEWLERYRPRLDLHFQAHLHGDAPLDALRSEPRFQALLAETR